MNQESRSQGEIRKKIEQDHYQIDFGRKIDEGAFSKIYSGIDKNGNPIICKIVDNKFFNIFETSIMRCIDHPNILHADYIQSIGDKIHIITKKMEGNITNVKFTVAQRKKICFQILQGLHTLHREGYIHGDLKCENILYAGDDPDIKICDFNISLPIKNYTHTICTPITRAPEVFFNEPWGEEIDIWSLGCVFYQVIFGQQLFRIDTCPQGEDRNVHIIRQIMYFLKSFCGEKINKFESRNFTSQKCDIDSRLFNQKNLESFRDLLKRIFKVDPKERITLLGIFNHKFFNDFKKLENRGLSSYKILYFPQKGGEEIITKYHEKLKEITNGKIPEKFILNMISQLYSIEKNEEKMIEFFKKLIKCIFVNRGLLDKDNISDFDILAEQLNKIEFMFYLTWK